MDRRDLGSRYCPERCCPEKLKGSGIHRSPPPTGNSQSRIHYSIVGILRSGHARERGTVKKDYADQAVHSVRVLPPEPEPEGKTRITIRLDQDIVDRFFEMAEQSGGATGYQTLINAALREYLNGKAPRFEETLRRIIREELKPSAA